MQDKIRFSTAFMQYFDFAPTDRTNAGSQGFRGCFFGRETGSQGISPPAALSNLAGGEDTFLEPKSMTIKGCLDAGNFNDIDPGF
jgi:hypothetical protein